MSTFYQFCLDCTFTYFFTHMVSPFLVVMRLVSIIIPQRVITIVPLTPPPPYPSSPVFLPVYDVFSLSNPLYYFLGSAVLPTLHWPLRDHSGHVLADRGYNSKYPALASYHRRQISRPSRSVAT